jgi:hypothetical protein
VTCTTPPICYSSPGTCNPSSGACSYSQANGTSCGTNMTCASGACLCSSGYTNCGTASVPNCVDFMKDINNCGACGTVCNSAKVVDATGLYCSSGSCNYTACATWNTVNSATSPPVPNVLPYLDCDGNRANGCESNPQQDATCGGCGLNCTLQGPTVHCVMITVMNPIGWICSDGT